MRIATTVILAVLAGAGAVVIVGVLTGAYASDNKKELQFKEEAANEEASGKKKDAEIKSLKEKIEALEAKVKEVTKTAEAVKIALESAKKDITNCMAEMQKIQKERDDVANQLAIAYKATAQAEADVKKIRTQYRAQEIAAEKLHKEVRELKADKESLEGKVTGLTLEQKKQKAEIVKLEGLVQKYQPDLGIAQDPKFFRNDKKLVVGFRPGKREEAEQLCKALGFELMGVFGPQNVTVHQKKPKNPRIGAAAKRSVL